MRRFTPLAFLLLVFLLSAQVRSDDPISSNITYSREIGRIFERKCLHCHAPGAVAMSLATYREARLWARAIREELLEQRMPPWRAARGYGSFANDIGLTSRELAMVLTWTDGGAPRGDDRDLPPRAPARPAAREEPDLRLPLPVQRIPAGEEYVIRRVTIDAAAAANRSIRRIAIEPGDTRVMRAAFVSLAKRGIASIARWIGAWTPWRRVVTPPEGAAFRLGAETTLMVELHYRGGDADAEDRSALAIAFAPDQPPVASHVVIETAPAAAVPGGAKWRGQSTLQHETRIWAILPQVSSYADPDDTTGAASSLEVTARKTDGSVEVLLWLPHRRYEWPTPYVLQTPLLLPAGTTIVVTSTMPHDGDRAELPASAAVSLSTVDARPPTEQSPARPPR